LTTESPVKTSTIGLVLIDVINDLDFPDSEKLLKQALPMARNLATLKRRAKQHRMPCIYVNDNFGQWKSDFRRIISHCIDDDTLGAPIVELLRPDEDDYFVLKPKHSGFHATTLEILLEYLGIKILILTGMATNICVLFTANDAYMRDYRLYVPCDCVAANTPEDTNYSLSQMKLVLKADIHKSTEINFDSPARRGRRTSPGSAAKLVHHRVLDAHGGTRKKSHSSTKSDRTGSQN
jgi:nicotinamidase-related amidase